MKMFQVSLQTPFNYGIFPDPRAAERKWMCMNLFPLHHWIYMVCTVTGAQGVLKLPTRLEWAWASNCWQKALPWHQPERVTVVMEGDRE